ncbi:MAG TPA: hypothetical protein VMV91_17190 [Rhodocyclaceae bacterium]|nr:hypothetical protein [Rhodocyclaceae bacterium]
MNPYEELIAKEEAKLKLLRKKVAACEQLIAALRGTDTDDIDAAIAKQIGQSAVVQDSHVSNAQQGGPIVAGIRTRKDSVAPLVLQYLGRDGKTLDEIESYMASIANPTTRGSLRTMLMNLRVKNQLVENPSHGFYKLSEAGAKAIGL